MALQLKAARIQKKSPGITASAFLGLIQIGTFYRGLILGVLCPHNPVTEAPCLYQLTILAVTLLFKLDKVFRKLA